VDGRRARRPPDSRRGPSATLYGRRCDFVPFRGCDSSVRLLLAMNRITAVLHTHDDALRLGRCLETLYPCDEILIVDYDSRDRTVQVAREYGARVVDGKAGEFPNSYLRYSGAEWILCLDPCESLTEGLAASLFEWKLEAVHSSAASSPAFSAFLREETEKGWIENPTAQTRLVPAGWNRWEGGFPAMEPSALTLEGEILRFALP
jgi:hypothetical protein